MWRRPPTPPANGWGFLNVCTEPPPIQARLAWSTEFKEGNFDTLHAVAEGQASQEERRSR
ncbi:MAG: hypothetical protein JWQ08_1836 [Deinococcus sp.]|nr:hypothetical protein [Deinococcus sp.]